MPAYSYSADGIDRFTTVYPNLNLLVNSSAKTKAGFFKDFDKVENGYGELTRKGNNSYAGISMWDGFSIQPGDYKPGDTYTMSMDVMFTSWNFPAGVYLEEFWIGQRYTHNSDWSINSWKRICYIDLPKDPSKMLNQWIRITYTSTIPPHEDPSVHTESIFLTKFSGSGEASFTLRIRKPKQEPGSTATPHMPSASEVTTADWPKYIGHYTDFTQADSTNPSDYTWSLFKGQDSNAYTAYAWSSDGVDRFSTVYPNLNLLDGSTKYTKEHPLIVSSSAEDGWSWVDDVYVKNLKAGTYTMSGKSDAPWTNHGINDVNRQGKKVGLWLVSMTPGLGVNIDLGDTVPKTIEVPKDGDYCVRVNLYSNGKDIVTHSFWDFKLETGSIATPWTPSQSESQAQWQDAIPMYLGVGEKDSQNPSDYRWQLNPRYVQASSDSGLSNKAGLNDLASVAETANDALVQAQNAVSNEDYTSWLEHDYQSTINNLQDVSAQNQEDINNVDDRTTIVEGFYGEMKVKWNFIDESFTFSEKGMFISNVQSKMAIQVTSDKIVFWDNNVDVAFITGEVLNIQKGVFLESATIGNHLITKFSDSSPVTIIRYVGGIT